MVVHTCNPRTEESEPGGLSQSSGQSELRSELVSSRSAWVPSVRQAASFIMVSAFSSATISPVFAPPPTLPFPASLSWWFHSPLCLGVLLCATHIPLLLFLPHLQRSHPPSSLSFFMSLIKEFYSAIQKRKLRCLQEIDRTRIIMVGERCHTQKNKDAIPFLGGI